MLENINEKLYRETLSETVKTMYTPATFIQFSKGKNIAVKQLHMLAETMANRHSMRAQSARQGTKNALYST